MFRSAGPAGPVVALAMLALAGAGCGAAAPAPAMSLDAGGGARDTAAEAGADGGGGACAAARAPIGQIAWSTDGRTMAFAHLDGRVTLVTVPLTAPRTLAVADGLARIALTEDGGLLATSRDGTVTLWSTADGAVMRTLAIGTGASVTLKFSDSPTPLLLATIAPAAPADNIKIWRIADGVLVGQLAGSPHGTFTHADEAVLLLDEARGLYQVRSFLGRVLRETPLPRPLTGTAFAMDGAYLGGVTTGPGPDDQRVAIMSVSDDAFVWQSTQPSRATRQLLFLENPSRVVQFADETRVLDHDDGKVLRALPALAGATAAVSSSDGATIAALDPEGRVILASPDAAAARPLPPSALCGP